MEFNKDGFLKMVDFFRSNIGRVFALYDPKPGTTLKTKEGLIKLEKLPGLRNKEAFVFHAKIYIDRYKSYPDEPQLLFNQDFTMIKIKESWESERKPKVFSGYKGRFYEV